jgi:hypothetical protein
LSLSGVWFQVDWDKSRSYVVGNEGVAEFQHSNASGAVLFLGSVRSSSAGRRPSFVVNPPGTPTKKVLSSSGDVVVVSNDLGLACLSSALGFTDASGLVVGSSTFPLRLEPWILECN